MSQHGSFTAGWLRYGGGMDSYGNPLPPARMRPMGVKEIRSLPPPVTRDDVLSQEIDKMNKNAPDELSSRLGRSGPFATDHVDENSGKYPERFGKLAVRTDANRQTINLYTARDEVLPQPTRRLRLLDDDTLKKFLPKEEATQEFYKKESARKMELGGRTMVEQMLDQPKHAIFGGTKKEEYRPPLAVAGPQWERKDLKRVEPAGFPGMGLYSTPMEVAKKKEGLYKYGPVPFSYEQQLPHRSVGKRLSTSFVHPSVADGAGGDGTLKRTVGGHTSCSELMASYRNNDYTLSKPSSIITNSRSHHGNGNSEQSAAASSSQTTTSSDPLRSVRFAESSFGSRTSFDASSMMNNSRQQEQFNNSILPPIDGKGPTITHHRNSTAFQPQSLYGSSGVF